jgi:hypothetical protein
VPASLVTLPEVVATRIESVVGKILVVGPQPLSLERETSGLAFFVVAARIKQRRARHELLVLATADKAAKIIFLAAFAAEGERKQEASGTLAGSLRKHLPLQ